MARRTHSPCPLRRALTAGAACLISSCGPAWQAPPVEKHWTRLSHTPIPQLQRGHVVHQEKCAKCHPYLNPADYGEEDLVHDIMPAMCRKSKLDAADSAAVLAYVLAARKLPPPAPEG